MTKLHVVTNSELEAWRTCPARWGFAYAELLRPKVDPIPITFGSLTHAGCAAGWMAAWQQPEISRAERLSLALSVVPTTIAHYAAEAREKIRSAGAEDEAEQLAELDVMQRTATWAASHYFERATADLDLVPLEVESSFRVQIPTKAGQGGMLALDGVIDLVLWDRESGRLLVEDHKTTGVDVGSFEKKAPLDTQLSGYVVAVRQLQSRAGLGHGQNTPLGARAVVDRHAVELMRATVGTIVYNVIRRAVPKAPKLNLLKKKDAITTGLMALLREQDADEIPRGEVSVAECDTLPEVYNDALLAQFAERELTITDKQRDFLERLKNKGDTFFRQLEYFRGDSELERWRKEIWTDARRMREALRDDTLRTRNPGACSHPWSPRCRYSVVCASPESPEAREQFRVATSPHEEVKHGHPQEENEGETQEFGF